MIKTVIIIVVGLIVSGCAATPPPQDDYICTVIDRSQLLRFDDGHFEVVHWAPPKLSCLSFPIGAKSTR